MRPNSVRPVRSLLLAGALTFAASTSAFALEGLPLFQSLVEQGNGKVTWASVEERGSDSFTMRDVRVTGGDGKETAIASLSADALREGADDTIIFDTMVAEGLAFAPTQRGDRATVDRVALNGATLPRKFSYGSMKPLDADSPNAVIASFEASAIAVTGTEFSFTMGSLTVNGLDMPATDKGTGASNSFMQPYSDASFDDVSFSIAGKTIAGMKRLAAVVSKEDGSGTIRSTSTLEGLMLDLTALPDERSRAIAGQLGYETIRGEGTGASTYNPTTGRAELEALDLRFEDALDVSMTMIVNGYTQAVAQQVQKLASQAQGAGGSMPMAQMLPLLEQITLENLNLTLTDRSLTGRLLDFQAAQMGTTGEQLAMSAPLFLSMGMGGLGMPGLTEMVSGAVGTFLQNKGALSVTISPPQPVSVATIATVSQADPKALPDLLGLSITAR
ncbi:hypothetical protein N9H93_02650 [Rhizobiaceae bacterium]|nr:hypothetical protein [Rhizobiaceae bacterium]